MFTTTTTTTTIIIISVMIEITYKIFLKIYQKSLLLLLQ